MSVPKLSVVMSVFDGEAFLADAMECVLNQTYRDFEFIVINDGSRDATLTILRDYAANDARIRIIDQENTGLTIALRRGIDQAKGEFIARMDVDDVSLPTRFEKQMALFERYPELVAVTTDVEHFFEDGSFFALAQLRRDTRLLPLLFVFSNIIGGHGQMIFRRDAYHQVGGYNPTFRYAQDGELWIRLADIGPFGIVPETLYRYRTGHENITTVFRSEQASFSDRTRQEQFRKITGLDLDSESARALMLFFWHGPGEDTSRRATWKLAWVMKRATNDFFAANPALAKQKFDVLYRFARRWVIRQGEIKSLSPVLRLIMVANTFRLGIAALGALLRHGTAKPPPGPTVAADVD